MDANNGTGAPGAFNNQQVDNAIRAIQQKRPLPEIDFTIHTMEDGTQVSTMERVCKGKFLSSPPPATEPEVVVRS